MIRRALLAGCALLLLPGVATAAACCVGSTVSQAERLGPCEFFSVGATWSIEARTGGWAASGALKLGGQDRRLTQRLIATAAVRPARFMQVGMSVPLVLQWKRVAGTDGIGAGPGDLTVWTWVEPFEDLGAPPAVPLPEFGFLLTLPTGVPVERATAPVGAGATGTGYAVLRPSLRLGRTWLKGSLHAAGGLGISPPRPGETRAPGVAWEGSINGAWFVRRDVTLSLLLGATGLTRGFADGKPVGAPSIEPWLSAGVALAPRMKGRLNIGVRTSLPIPGLGRSQEATVLFAVGGTFVTRQRPTRARSRGV